MRGRRRPDREGAENCTELEAALEAELEIFDLEDFGALTPHPRQAVPGCAIDNDIGLVYTPKTPPGSTPFVIEGSDFSSHREAAQAIRA